MRKELELILKMIVICALAIFKSDNLTIYGKHSDIGRKKKNPNWSWWILVFFGRPLCQNSKIAITVKKKFL